MEGDGHRPRSGGAPVEVSVLLPVAAPIAIAFISGGVAIWTSRRSSRVQEAAARAQSRTSQFDQAIELDKYTQERIDAAVAKAIAPYVERIERLEQGYSQVVRTLRSVRQAFREYIRAVRAQWGHAVEPPAVDAHIRDLLAEDDLDGTFDAAGIAQARQNLIDDQSASAPAHD
ncbi:hypothetical protein DEI99_005350 [Curtobacterium sp. MCLR17_036]|uniref:hypothetical protein n=1 Tax=Curtobacterium sp. MCLR17_036 TaxID=2175620 RepID=UPI0024DFB371|nr:hypothetical protein [Curtobacterium sp. MCLR17_036]WIE65965.1 hypothetical protein DEI99_005350 [Curtobacterium sp. MCLR17_036]